MTHPFWDGRDDRGRGVWVPKLPSTTPPKTYRQMHLQMQAFMCVHTVQLMCHTHLVELGQALYCPTLSPKAVALSKERVLYFMGFVFVCV